jgi:hypothetical protein
LTSRWFSPARPMTSANCFRLFQSSIRGLRGQGRGKDGSDRGQAGRERNPKPMRHMH